MQITTASMKRVVLSRRVAKLLPVKDYSRRNRDAALEYARIADRLGGSMRLVKNNPAWWMVNNLQGFKEDSPVRHAAEIDQMLNALRQL